MRAARWSQRLTERNWRLRSLPVASHLRAQGASNCTCRSASQGQTPANAGVRHRARTRFDRWWEGSSAMKKSAPKMMTNQPPGVIQGHTPMPIGARPIDWNTSTIVVLPGDCVFSSAVLMAKLRTFLSRLVMGHLSKIRVPIGCIGGTCSNPCASQMVRYFFGHRNGTPPLVLRPLCVSLLLVLSSAACWTITRSVSGSKKFCIGNCGCLRTISISSDSCCTWS